VVRDVTLHVKGFSMGFGRWGVASLIHVSTSIDIR
jgi:hypothetical protein